MKKLNNFLFGKNGFFRFKIGKAILYGGFLPFLILACDPVGSPGSSDGPDLVVSDISIIGDSYFDAGDNLFRVPITVKVENQGDMPADLFKVAVDYIHPGEEFISPGQIFVTSFVVPGEPSVWYPYTNEPLSAGSEITFTGYVVFRSTLEGKEVTFYAIADSCSGDEFMPDHCRVEEIDESNNISDQVSITL